MINNENIETGEKKKAAAEIARKNGELAKTNEQNLRKISKTKAGAQAN
jgi:hypothetical protein